MTEPNAGRKQGLAHLLAVVHDPSADAKRRDAAANILAQIYIPSAKSNGSDGGFAPPVAMNGDAAARRKAREDEILRVATEIAKSAAGQQVLKLIPLVLG